MKKILGIALALVLLLCSFSYAGTMGEAFDFKGDATVGMGRAPLGHRLLWPITDSRMREIRDFIAKYGTFSDQGNYIVSILRINKDWTIIRLGRIGGFLWFRFLVSEEAISVTSIAKNVDIMLSALTDGSLGPLKKERNRFPMVAVLIDTPTSLEFLYVMNSKNTPSIYASEWRRQMFKFYREYVYTATPEPTVTHIKVME